MTDNTPQSRVQEFLDEWRLMHAGDCIHGLHGEFELTVNDLAYLLRSHELLMGLTQQDKPRTDMERMDLEIEAARHVARMKV